MNPIKRALARAFDVSGLNWSLLYAQRLFARLHLRAVNYHGIPRADADAFERQLRYYQRYFAPVGLEQVDALSEGQWHHDKPGLLISFDDGLRSHADVAAPLLEEYGFVGWFMIPTGFVATPVADQIAFAAGHRISAKQDYPDGRIALSWDEIRRLDRRHVIGCHTRNHTRLASTLTSVEYEEEIVGARRDLAEQLGHEIDVFAWVGGEEQSYSSAAAAMIHQAGYRYSLMTNSALFRPGDSALHIQRTNVEADFPMAVTKFQLSGFIDMLYTPKRRRVQRLTATRD